MTERIELTNAITGEKVVIHPITSAEVGGKKITFSPQDRVLSIGEVVHHATKANLDGGKERNEG